MFKQGGKEMLDEEEKLTLTMARYKELTDVESKMIFTNDPKMIADVSEASEDESGSGTINANLAITER